MNLIEDTRKDLLAQGKRGKKEQDGKNRYEKRLRSKVASTTRAFNSIDMQSLFAHDILTLNIPVTGETSNYEVRIKYGDFLEILQKYVKNQKDTLDLRAITRALLDGFDRGDVYIHCTCLHPDTKIKTDNAEATIKELKEMLDRGEKVYVHSTDGKGKFALQPVESIWISSTTSRFTQVTLDSGESIITTPAHLYMLSDGSYEKACKLKRGRSLMSLDGRVVSDVRSIYLPDTPVYDISVGGWPNFETAAGVYLHNCADWKYRMGFWASMKKINSGVPENRPSKITNPRNNLGPGCKHVMLVLSNNSWLITVARVILNYIIYMEKYKKKEYADIIYPAIYGKKYEKPVQLSMDDSDVLDSDSETINRANVMGRTRGQFKTGNPYRFKPQTKHPENQLQMQFDDEPDKK